MTGNEEPWRAFGQRREVSFLVTRRGQVGLPLTLAHRLKRPLLFVSHRGGVYGFHPFICLLNNDFICQTVTLYPWKSGVCYISCEEDYIGERD